MSFISTNKATCKDCHRCIRACPTKAIGLRDGQCWVIAERCVLCGACLTACPQGAKVVANAADRVNELLASGREVIAGIAPSYPAAGPRPGQFVAALRRLGFSAVEEVAIGAAPVAATYRQHMLDARGPVISACCPVIVSLIETRYPSLVPLLAPSSSPMIAHAHDVAQRRPGSAYVFIGPCVAKMREATRPEAAGEIAAVLTFDQVMAMFTAGGIDPAGLDDEASDIAAGSLAAFPLTRGIRQAAGFDTLPASRFISADGIEECTGVLAELAGALSSEAGEESSLATEPVFLELLACQGGCVGGAGLRCTRGLVARQRAVTDYAAVALPSTHRPESVPSRVDNPDAFPARPEYSDEEIRRVLARIGKPTAADERNCGACGYNTCRDKAVAVLEGLAEPEMCISFMREKFETLAHAVVEDHSSAVIVVNAQMRIQVFNPAAHRLFNAAGVNPHGLPLADFLDPVHFQRVWDTKDRIVGKRVAYPALGLATRQTIYPLDHYETVVGIISDITAEEARDEANQALRLKTAEKAKEVIANQMRLVQEVAGLLGEATAESKATLLELVSLLTGKGEG